VQRFEDGWRAISLYTGVSIGGLRAAVDGGDLDCGDPAAPRATHRALDLWLLERLLTADLLDDGAELVVDADQAPKRPAA
jgi:hypothetical protein